MATYSQNLYLGQQLTRVLLQGRTVRCGSMVELHTLLRREGLNVVRNDSYGPPGGRQLFYRSGGVVVRIKTLGDEKGYRANQPHLSIGLVDEAGLDWQHERGKFTASGRLTAKSIVTPESFQVVDHDGNPQRFIVIQGGEYDGPSPDTWAQSTHFPLPEGFDATGAEQIIPVPGQE